MRSNKDRRELLMFPVKLIGSYCSSGYRKTLTYFQLVGKPDQILPHYVMDVTDGVPGLPGLFVAALVSAALSAMSGGLNTVAGTIWEDFISAHVPESETKQETATKVMKVGKGKNVKKIIKS